MSVVPLAERVVEVIVTIGPPDRPRYRYGSGCIVRGRTVLTAAHVVAGAGRVQVRDVDKNLYETGEHRLVGDPAGNGPDLALIEIEDAGIDLPPIGLAVVDRDSPTAEPVERCQVVGYPWFAQVHSPAAIRDTVQTVGVIPVLSKLARGLLSVQVDYPPRELPPGDASLAESPWSGISGAPVVADGQLLGVVTENALREGPSSITAVPLTALDHDPAHPGWGSGVPDSAAWWARLGVTGAADLPRLPAKPRRPEPAYRATLRDVGRALHSRMPKLVGRETELAEIAAFAAGPAGYLWLVGGAYAGKSALVYEAISSGLPADVDVVSYFLSRRSSDADSVRFLTAMVAQLAFLCEVDPPVADRDQFNLLWERAAARAVATGRDLLLVVDGLDEDVYPVRTPSVAALLPTFVEGRSHVLVTSRPHPGLPDDLADGHPLRAVGALNLEPFAGSRVRSSLAEKEIRDVTRSSELACTVFGLLTAAAAPLTVSDLAALSAENAPATAAQRARIWGLVTEDAARSLEPVGSGDVVGYQFAHASLLEDARADPRLSDPEYPHRIRRWAAHWRELGWPTTSRPDTTTPRYLLDGYPELLSSDPVAMSALVGDIGWIETAIRSVGPERVLAVLQIANLVCADRTVRAMLAVVAGQAANLGLTRPLDQPSYVLRQLCLRALESGEDELAAAARARLLSFDDGGPVPLWTTHRASPALTLELGRQLGPMFAVQVLPDGRVVAVGASGVHVWAPEAGADPSSSFGSGTVGAVAVLADGNVATADRQGRLRVWNPATPRPEPVEVGVCEPSLHALAVLPDGRIVSAAPSGIVQLWNLRVPGSPEELGRYERRVMTLAVSSDGRVLAAGDSGRIVMWDPAEPGASVVEVGRHSFRVYALIFLLDGRVVSGGRDGSLLAWDLRTHGKPVELGRHSRDGSAVLGLALLPGGRVVSCGFDGRLCIWDAASPGEPVELGSHDGPATAVAACPDGQVVSVGGDGRVRIWQTRGSNVDTRQRVRDDAWPDSVAFLADGRVVTAGRRGRIVVWDPTTPTGDPVEVCQQRGAISQLAPLPDGLLATDGAEWRPRLWDPATPGGDPTTLGAAHLDGEDGSEIEDSCSMSVLPDGRLISTGGQRIRLWVPSRPEADGVGFGPDETMLDESPNGVPHPLAVLPGGGVVSGHSDGRILLWNAAAPSAEPVEVGTVEGTVVALAGLPDGRAVSADSFGRLLIWSPESSGAQPFELAALGEDAVDALAALADGRVVSAGRDSDVRIWDCSTRRETARISLAFAALAVTPLHVPDQRLATAHLGRGITVWSVPSASRHDHDR